MGFDSIIVVYGVEFNESEIDKYLGKVYDSENDSNDFPEDICDRKIYIYNAFEYESNDGKFKVMKVWQPSCCFSDNDNRKVVGIQIGNISTGKYGLWSSDNYSIKEEYQKEIRASLKYIDIEMDSPEFKVWFLYNDCYYCT